MKTRLIAALKTTTAGKVIEVSLHYEKGGSNVFSGATSKRGYYISISPISYNNGIKTFVMFSGAKQFVKEAARFSQNTLDNISVDESEYKDILAHVLTKNSCQLE